MNTHPGDTMTTSDQVTVHHDDCLTAVACLGNADNHNTKEKKS